MSYKYEVKGTGSGGSTFTCEGKVPDRPGDFTQVFQDAMLESFRQLTSGKAVFGQPGVGCRGPYNITRFLMEEVADA